MGASRNYVHFFFGTNPKGLSLNPKNPKDSERPYRKPKTAHNSLSFTFAIHFMRVRARMARAF